MKWWKRAMPAPKASDYPHEDNRDRALEKLDRHMTDDTASSATTDHPEMGYLGHGNHGVAFQKKPRSNTVVKFTFEKSEADVANHLIKNPCPCVVQVFSVRQVQAEPNRPIWELTLEKVAPLGQMQKEFVAQFCQEENFLAGDHESVLVQMTGMNADQWAKNVDISPEDRMWQQKFDECYQKYKELLECLDKNSLMPTDAHEDNIGIRNGRFVMLDLGLMT